MQNSSVFWSFYPYNAASQASSSLILCSLLAFLAIPLRYYLRSRTGLPLPPGPRRWPIVGNVLQIPKEKEWLTYTEWGRNYGPILSLTVFGQTFIILNSLEPAIDLLQKRSPIYSDRPHLPFACGMVGWHLSLGLTPYGERFRHMRRLTHQIFNPQAAKSFWGVEEQETAKFLNKLLQSPGNVIDHIRHMVGAVVLNISHGYTVSEAGNDPMVKLAETTVEEFSTCAIPGTYLIDFIPWSICAVEYVPSWLPGAGFKRTAKEMRDHTYQMANTAHDFTKNQMERQFSITHGLAIPSFTSKLLEGGVFTADLEDLVKWTAFSIYGAGSDTTVAAITTFFLAMCLHPEVQGAAQAELDAVIGVDKLPTVEDRPRLPYIEAVLKEVLRWGPVGPLGGPHRLIQEDIYEGYRIPAGSIVFANIWAMTHDPIIFPQPEEFRPSRFVGPDCASTDPLQIVFGFGRRVCPGQHLAESSLFLAIAMTLATFTISKSRDKQSGKVLEPAAEWSPGAISHPVPFTCDIKPRSAHAIKVVKCAVEEG